MKKSRQTKRALIPSILAVILCAAMLVGTTFAWFTDTASTSVNKIEAGKLDVDIQDNAGNSLNGKTLSFKDKNGSADILWEPGATFKLESFKIVNKGNLALKYEILVNGVSGNAKLLEAIDFTATMGTTEYTLGNLSGNIIPDGKTPGEGEVAGETGLITISGTMKTDAGNAYQGLSLDGIAITVVAEQYTYEYDSTDNTYDSGASVYTANSTDEAQKLLDSIDGAAVIELAAGDYGTLYLRQSLDSSTRRTDLDNDASYPAYYREFNNVTIRAAANANVTCDGIKVEAGLFWHNTAPASNQDEMHANSGFNSYLSLKNISIEGITFNNSEQVAIWLHDNSGGSQLKGSALYVNGFTVKNCTGTGSTSNSDVHFFQAGSGAADAPFCDVDNGVKGLNNITITGCTMNNYSQAITFNNDVATLNNLTVSNNNFTGCTDNNVQISNKVNSGVFTFSDNTLTSMNGRFVRMANAAADAVITVDNTTVTSPTSYDVNDAGQIFKVTGTKGFKVSSNGNSGWTVVTNDGTTWIANGDTSILPTGTYN